MTVLVIGNATDGPIDRPYVALDFDSYQAFYGNSITEVQTISASATATSLEYTPYFSLSDSVSSKGENQLYSPEFTGTTLTFGALGGLGPYRCEIKYRPYLGYSDLLTAVANMYLQSSKFPYALRCKGDPASVTLNDWEFSAPTDGARYNGHHLSVTSTTLTLTWKTGEIVTYDVSDLDTFYDTFNKDFYLGIVPVLISNKGTTISGSGYTSGGSDGELDPDTLEWILDNVAIPASVDSVVILDEYEDDYGTVINNYCSEKTPKMFFFAGQGDNIETPVPFETLSPYVTVIQGFTSITTEVLKTRYAVETVVGAMQDKDAITLTNHSIAVESFSPAYTESELNDMFDIGVCGLVRKIRNGVSVYQATTLDNTKSFSTNMAVPLIHSKVRSYLEKYKGSYLKIGSHPEIADEVANIVLLIKGFTLQAVECDVQTYFDYDGNDTLAQSFFGDILHTKITGYVYDEILTIDITVESLK